MGTNQNALVTFLKIFLFCYSWAAKWSNYCIDIVTQKFKMAAVIASFFNFNKPITQIVCNIADSCIIPTALPIFHMSGNSMKMFSILGCATESQLDGGSQRGNTNNSECIRNKRGRLLTEIAHVFTYEVPNSKATYVFYL